MAGDKNVKMRWRGTSQLRCGFRFSFQSGVKTVTKVKVGELVIGRDQRLEVFCQGPAGGLSGTIRLGPDREMGVSPSWSHRVGPYMYTMATGGSVRPGLTE